MDEKKRKKVLRKNNDSGSFSSSEGEDDDDVENIFSTIEKEATSQRELINETFKMKKDEETNGRQLQLESKTVNKSALAVTKANQTEIAKVEE